MATRSRRLTEAEQALWDAVARGLTPLRPRAPKAAPAPPIPPSPRKAPANVSMMAPRPGSVAAPREPDRPTRRALRSGKLPIERKIDLHGMTQAEAHHVLQRAVVDGKARRLLVVTGRGTAKTGGGILRRMVPRWLAEPTLASRVIAVGAAGREHGGEGAFYILLRRMPDRRSSS